MRLTCPTCSTTFEVPENALGTQGRKLRCAKCAAVWFQEPITPADPPPMADYGEQANLASPVRPPLRPVAEATPTGGGMPETVKTTAPEAAMETAPRAAMENTSRSAAQTPPNAAKTNAPEAAPPAGPVPAPDGPPLSRRDDPLWFDDDDAPTPPVTDDPPSDPPAAQAFSAFLNRPRDEETASESPEPVTRPVEGDAHSDVADRSFDPEPTSGRGRYVGVAPEGAGYIPRPGGGASLANALDDLEMALDHADAVSAPMRAPSSRKRRKQDKADIAEDGGRLPRVTRGPAPVRRAAGRRVLEIASVVLIIGSVIATSLLLFRNAIVAAVPETIRLYSFLNVPVDTGTTNVIAFQDVVVEFEESDGRRTAMTLKGLVYNASETETLAVPDLILKILDGDQHTLQQIRSPAPKPMLAPQETVAFEISMKNPSALAKDISLSLAGPR